MLNSLFNLILDKNLGRATPQKLAVVVGEPLVNPTLKSHTSNAGLKSHTLQLHPNVPPCFPVPVPMQTGYALACFDQSQVNTAMPTSSPTLLVCSWEPSWKAPIPIDKNLGRVTPQKLAVVVGEPKAL